MSESVRSGRLIPRNRRLRSLSVDDEPRPPPALSARHTYRTRATIATLCSFAFGAHTRAHGPRRDWTARPKTRDTYCQLADRDRSAIPGRSVDDRRSSQSGLEGPRRWRERAKERRFRGYCISTPTRRPGGPSSPAVTRTRRSYYYPCESTRDHSLVMPAVASASARPSPSPIRSACVALWGTHGHGAPAQRLHKKTTQKTRQDYMRPIFDDFPTHGQCAQMARERERERESKCRAERGHAARSIGWN